MIEIFEEMFEEAFGIALAYRVEEPFPLLPVEVKDWMITITEKEILENKISALKECIDNLTELYEMNKQKLDFIIEKLEMEVKDWMIEFTADEINGHVQN